jgi:hypothetical protein
MKMDIEGTIDELCSNLVKMIKDMDSGSYVARPLPLERLKNWSRESYQEIFREPALLIIRKLKMDEPLTEDEAKLIEEWMVGDIELYKVMEVHYDEWRNEVTELSERLRQCDHPGVGGDPKSLLNIMAVLIDLEHVLRDIDHYRYALDRIGRFRSFVGQDINSMPHADKVALADNMRNMIYSDMS